MSKQIKMFTTPFSKNGEEEINKFLMEKSTDISNIHVTDSAIVIVYNTSGPLNESMT